MHNKISKSLIHDTLYLILIVFGLFGLVKSAWAATITLNPATTYQTFRAWSVEGWAFDNAFQNCPIWTSNPTLIENNLADKMVNEMGYTSLTLGIRLGIENNYDWFREYSESYPGHDENWWVTKAYLTTNDNADPNITNPAGFGFLGLDDEVKKFWLPMKAKVESTGQTMEAHLKLVDFPRAARSWQQCDDASGAELAEYYLAVLTYLKNTYNLTPTYLDFINEPDNIGNVPSGCWNDPIRLGTYIKTVGDKLAANGFHPKFKAPSAMSASTSLSWFNSIWSNAQARQYIGDISFHEYSGVSDTVLQNIGNKASSNGIQSAMTEFMSISAGGLNKDLVLAGVSSWCGGYTFADFLNIDCNTGAVTVKTDNTKFIRQYTKFIRPGALRISATTDNSNFNPVAFINNGGRYVVVVNAAGAGSFSILGLPAGTYGIKYSTWSLYDKDLADVVLQPGQTLTTNIPEIGAITIYAKSTGSPDTTPPAVPNGLSVN